MPAQMSGKGQRCRIARHDWANDGSRIRGNGLNSYLTFR